MINQSILGKGLFSLLMIFQLQNIEGTTTWSDWSSWGACSVSCGKGFHVRKRLCLSRDPETSQMRPLRIARDCIGAAEMHSPCQRLSCPEIVGSQRPNHCECGCILQTENGNITSSIKIDNEKICEWSIEIPQKKNIALNIYSIELLKGYLTVTSSKTPVISLPFPNERKLPIQITTMTNLLRVQLVLLKTEKEPISAAIAMAYHTLKEPVTSQDMNSVKPSGIKDNKPIGNRIYLPGLIGMTTCGVIIGLTIIVVFMLRFNPRNREKENNGAEKCDV